ncbi:complex I intermediate-associated protein 30 [Ophiocordyceps camponoti-floridani]|uniref:Complex I intermediate-associated protein 30 n=1 Tax=Ophiocordyceps camponoti-floridani TaxID=2030778 RepID=A0A8H4Q2S4_9HYPO|nr:complex I intermediate-associated protein 30 [Ophiocordyceps camponoti-floridani]
MRASSPRFARRGFLMRSLDELRRRASIAWNLEAIKDESRLLLLLLPLLPSIIHDNNHNRTHNTTNLLRPLPRHHLGNPPPNRPKTARSGYAAFRTPDQPPTLFGRSVWDVDPYAYLALRVKSDGRAYFVNLQAESVEMTDLHQHRLFVRRPGVWETVLLPWSDFVRTNYGAF